MVLFDGGCHFKYTAVEFNSTASMLDGASEGTMNERQRKREIKNKYSFYWSRINEWCRQVEHLPSSIVRARFEFDGRPSTVL